MIQTFILSSSSTTRAKHPWLECVFSYKGQKWVVSEDFSVYPFGELPKGLSVRVIKLGPSAGRDNFVIKYDDTPNPNAALAMAGELRTKKDTDMARFVKMLLADERVAAPALGKPESASTSWYLENPTINDEKRLNVSEKKAKAFIAINQMDLDELVDLCYFLGDSPGKKNAIELKAYLSDLDHGIAMQSTIQPSTGRSSVKSNLDAVLEDFIGDRESSRVLSDANMAINLKVIESKGGVFYWKSQLIGSTIEQVISYLINDPKARKAIVAECEGSRPKVTNNLKASNQAIPGETEVSHEEGALRQRAKELKIISFHNKKIPALQKEVFEVTKLRELADENGIDPDQVPRELMDALDEKQVEWRPIVNDYANSSVAEMNFKQNMMSSAQA